MNLDKLPRDVVQAMWRGFRGRCPACGEGRLFRSFLKVNESCSECGEELHHHRADDFPAYLVIVIVGHIVVPLVLAVETHLAPAYWIHLALWLPLTLGLSLAPVAAGQRRSGRPAVVPRHARLRAGQARARIRASN